MYLILRLFEPTSLNLKLHLQMRAFSNLACIPAYTQTYRIARCAVVAKNLLWNRRARPDSTKQWSQLWMIMLVANFRNTLQAQYVWYYNYQSAPRNRSVGDCKWGRVGRRHAACRSLQTGWRIRNESYQIPETMRCWRSVIKRAECHPLSGWQLGRGWSSLVWDCNVNGLTTALY